MVCVADLTYAGLAQRKSNGFLIRGSGVRISYPVPEGNLKGLILMPAQQRKKACFRTREQTGF